MNRILAHTLARQAASNRAAYITSPLRKIGGTVVPRSR